MRLACSIRVPHHFDAVHSASQRVTPKDLQASFEDLDDPEAKCRRWSSRRRTLTTVGLQLQ